MRCKFARVTQQWNLAQISVLPLLVSNPVGLVAPRVQAVALPFLLLARYHRDPTVDPASVLHIPLGVAARLHSGALGCLCADNPSPLSGSVG